MKHNCRCLPGEIMCYIKGEIMCYCKNRDPHNVCAGCKLDVTWKYGHITSDGHDAKYLGPSYLGPGFLGWLIDGKILITNDQGAVHSYNITIKNKSAPEKWYPIFRHPKTTVYPNGQLVIGNHAYSSKDKALTIDQSYGGPVAVIRID